MYCTSCTYSMYLALPYHSTNIGNQTIIPTTAQVRPPGYLHLASFLTEKGRAVPSHASVVSCRVILPSARHVCKPRQTEPCLNQRCWSAFPVKSSNSLIEASLCLFVVLFPSPLSISVSISVCLSISVSVSVFLSLYPSPLLLTLSISLFLPPSPSPFPSLFISPSAHLTLSPHIPPPFSPSHGQPRLTPPLHSTRPPKRRMAGNPTSAPRLRPAPPPPPTDHSISREAGSDVPNKGEGHETFLLRQV